MTPLDFFVGFGAICATFGFLIGIVTGTWITAVCRKCQACKQAAWEGDHASV